MLVIQSIFLTPYYTLTLTSPSTDSSAPPVLASMEDLIRAQGVELGVTPKIKKRRSSIHAAYKQLFDRPPPTNSLSKGIQMWRSKTTLPLRPISASFTVRRGGGCSLAVPIIWQEVRLLNRLDFSDHLQR